MSKFATCRQLKYWILKLLYQCCSAETNLIYQYGTHYCPGNYQQFTLITAFSACNINVAVQSSISKMMTHGKIEDGKKNISETINKVFGLKKNNQEGEESEHISPKFCFAMPV